MRTEDIGTEVFFFPAAAHTEKNGSFTNTQRLLQWHHAAVEPAGHARSDLWFFYHLGRIIRQKLAGSTEEMDRPVVDLQWDYPTEGSIDEPGWAWPANRRIIYNRCSADRDGNPWSDRKALIWWSEEQGKWVGHDIPDFDPSKSPWHRPRPALSGRRRSPARTPS